MKTFVESVDNFVKASPWLSLEDDIAVTSLYHMAEELDAELTAPILSAFGLTYRSLAKKAPVAKEASELGKLLQR